MLGERPGRFTLNTVTSTTALVHGPSFCISMHASKDPVPSHALSPRSSLLLNKLCSKFRERKNPSLLVRNIPLTPSPLIFKKAVDHTCSCFVLRCGNHNEGNGTECAICLGAVALRFYGNTLPIVTVTLPSFLSLPTILRNSLSHKNGVERGQA